MHEKNSGTGVVPTKHFFFLQNWDDCHFMWCKYFSIYFLILSQFTRLTDRQTDRRSDGFIVVKLVVLMILSATEM